MTDMMKRIPVLAALDKDGDGTISETELTGAPKSLRKLDRNGDGDISVDEIRPTPGGPSPGRGQGSARPGQRPAGGQDRASMMRRTFSQSDRNDDGQLSGGEIPPQMRRMIDRIDTDGDGAISKSEMETMISRRSGQGRPPGRRGN